MQTASRFLTKAFLLCCLVFQFSSNHANAWNGPGHMVAARIAYEHLTPATRSAVDSLLTNHPNYNVSVTIAQSVAQPAQVNEAVFMLAATWPDEIRDDSRFYDDVKGQVPTPLVDGYPDMAKHTNWHFIDLPFSEDSTPTPPSSAWDRHNAVAELDYLAYDVNHTTNRASKVYDLPWILHLTGNVHQPLHCATRFSHLHTSGDFGGNLFVLHSGQKLHSYWDELIAPSYNYTKPEHSAKDLATALSVSIPQMEPSTQALLSHTKPSKWALESFAIAKSFVYTIGAEQDKPAPSLAYAQEARQIAGQRILLAGLRLAAGLNRFNLN